MPSFLARGSSAVRTLPPNSLVDMGSATCLGTGMLAHFRIHHNETHHVRVGSRQTNGSVKSRRRNRLPDGAGSHHSPRAPRSTAMPSVRLPPFSPVS